MDTIEKLVDFLKQYPFIKYEHRQGAITVFPSSEKGFEVALVVSPEWYTVCFDFWHTESSDEQMAMNAFKNGLSDAIRLIVTSRGGVDYRWSLESREAGGWIGCGTVRIFRYPFWIPFWKKKMTRYLHNDYFIATSRQEYILSYRPQKPKLGDPFRWD